MSIPEFDVVGLTYGKSRIDKELFLRQHVGRINLTSLWIFCHSVPRNDDCNQLIDIMSAGSMSCLDFATLFQHKLMVENGRFEVFSSLKFWEAYKRVMQSRDLYDDAYASCAHLIDLPSPDENSTDFSDGSTEY